MGIPKIRFVVATRSSREEFFARTATGRSLDLYKFPFVELNLTDRNQEGLPFVYNQAIEAAKSDPAILVFIHDDVHLCDFYWPDQILNAFSHFQIIGVVGNKRRAPRQASWCLLDVVDNKMIFDEPENFSGVIGHGTGFPPEEFHIMGNPCQEVKLLDGVIIAGHSSTFLNNELRFDERFDFHFYDLDFCRQAELKRLKMGTWSLSVIHESKGNIESQSWKNGYKKYLEKWGG